MERRECKRGVGMLTRVIFSPTNLCRSYWKAEPERLGELSAGHYPGWKREPVGYTTHAVRRFKCGLGHRNHNSHFRSEMVSSCAPCLGLLSYRNFPTVSGECSCFLRNICRCIGTLSCSHCYPYGAELGRSHYREFFILRGDSPMRSQIRC